MTVLDQILDRKRRDVADAKRHRPLARIREELPGVAPPRDFFGAVAAPTHRPPRLIAEIKKRSPSAGLIVPDLDLADTARTYAHHGAAAISVLTDAPFFDGRIEYIDAVKRTVPLPVLRKDFIVDAYQLYESRAAGADAVLLIAEALGADRVAKLVDLGNALGMTCLVEVHAEENLEAVLACAGQPGPGRYLLGINNRDLDTQTTDIATTARLAARLPPGVPFIAESGIATRADVEHVVRAGAAAILVGESLLTAPDVGTKIDELMAR